MGKCDNPEIFKAKDEADMVAECPAETAPFGGVGGEHEVEAYD
jgi:hypothetical protein